MHRFAWSMICVAASASAAPNSDCVAGNADSSCISNINRGPVASPPSVDVLFDGPIAGTPSSSAGYWGYDFLAASSGSPSPAPRDMFINRSASAISLIFSFDLPQGPCGYGCRPGMEFKLNAKWNSFFPNIVVSGSKAITSVQIAPGQAYGFAIALWQASNPRVKVQNLSSATVSLQDVGLNDFSSATPIPGIYFQCECGDGLIKQCYSGTHFSNGLMGGWRNDGYFPWDEIGCN